jgi:hypothetical protein
LATWAPPRPRNPANLDLQTEVEVFLLPGGYVDEQGRLHDEAQLSPLTGLDESVLASLGLGACAASIVTSVLARCVKRIGSCDRVDASLVRELLVADRDYLIIKLRRLTLGPRVDCVLRCPDLDCGKLMDLSLNLDELEFERSPVHQRYLNVQLSPGAAELESDFESEFGLDEPARSIEFRFPNGGDQEFCAPLFSIDKNAAVTELLSRCIRRIDNCRDVDRMKLSSLDHAERLELEETLGQLAPRVEIELDASCPECEKPLDTSFDVLTFFLEELTSGRRNLEREVHFLAWHYHWSEHEILSMTQRKRRRYVALVQQEVDRLNQVW